MQTGTDQRVIIHTSIKPKAAAAPEIRKKPAGKTDFSERLLRNTALACALLLGILTLRNVDSPWSQAAVNGLESALTMRIDPDAALGQLEFVRSIIPESTLVFFEMSASSVHKPVSGETEHEHSDSQPWTLYACDEGADVCSTDSGTVSAVMDLGENGWCVMIDHGAGKETLYAYLADCEVDAGDSVAAGGIIGHADNIGLYYELRIDGKSVSPTEETGN